MQVPYSERYDGMQIKIERKRLRSGKWQVKFQTDGLLQEDCYGYALVDDEKSIQDVVRYIKRRLMQSGSINRYYQQNLFSLKRNWEPEEGMVIFRSQGLN